MKTKIEIKSVFGKLLFEYEKENNTVKDTVIEAIAKSAYLRDADLQGADLRGAYLRDADLQGADLRDAYLQGAYLQGAYLQGADLRGAYLRDADLQGADLRDAYLQGAYLQGADLRDAYLQGAYLQGAYLQGANLRDAYLQGADLRDIKIENIESFKKFYWNIPEEGAFIAWKKLEHDCIAKIEIPAEAKRTCNLINPRKCRAEYVKVLEIKDQEGKNKKSAFNCSYSGTKLRYDVGKLVYPDSYDDSIYQNCSHGIHFFITRQEAIDWNN